MRKLIASMKMSLDAKIEGPQQVADWVDAWSDDTDLTPQIDACVLGAGMYGGYESYWTTIKNGPDKPLEMTGKPPTEAEVRYARFATQIPHYLLSNTVTQVAWPNTTILKRTADVAALKKAPGKDIYLVGGARILVSLLEAGLVDELRLIVYPLIAGEGKTLFGTVTARHKLELRNTKPLEGGRVRLTYGIV